MVNICVFAGTTEGRRLVEFLNEQPALITVCTATEYGGELIEPGERLVVRSGRMDEPDMESLFCDGRFDLVIDATHPYAAAVTENLLLACRNTRTEYLRLERGGEGAPESAVCVPDIAAAVEYLNSTMGNVLLTTGSQISLKYPKSGERLSAFLVEDLDDDGSDEAIVFYETGRNAVDENPLRICMLDQTDGAWRAISEYAAAGAEIDRVDLVRLGSNPRLNLIISYSMVDGAEHAAEVYHYADGTLECSRSLHYSAMALRDLNQDGTLELFTVSAAKAPDPAAATAYALGADGIYAQSQINLPEAFTDIQRLVYGDLPTGTGNESIPAIYIDGTTGATSVQTVVLHYSDNRLRLDYSDRADRFPNTTRAGGYQTLDIDGNGEAEIPVNTVFYGYSNAAEASKLSMTNWYVCRNRQLIRARSSYYSGQDGYVFLLPRRWERCVTALPENDEIVFYEFDTAEQQANGEPILKDPLLRLAVVTDPVAADAMQSDGYLLLREQSGRYYLGRLLNGSRTLTLRPSELMTAMKYL